MGHTAGCRRGLGLTVMPMRVDSIGQPSEDRFGVALGQSRGSFYPTMTSTPLDHPSVEERRESCKQPATGKREVSREHASSALAEARRPGAQPLVGVHRDDLRRAFDTWWAPDYADLRRDGRLAKLFRRGRSSACQ